MPTVLFNIVRFVNVADGAIVALPHRIRLHEVPKLPDIIGRSNGDFAIVACDATDVTVQNNSGGIASCDVLVWQIYSPERVFFPINLTEMTPRPYILAAGGGGAPTPTPGLSTCLIYQPGGAETGPGTFNDWADLMAQLNAYRAAANNDGCYTIMFDDSLASPAVIPAGGPYDMHNVTWEGDDSGFGAAVEIADGASFTELRTFRKNLTVSNANTVTPACADLADGDIIHLDSFCNIETVNGGAPFFEGAGLGAGAAIGVFITGSSSTGAAADGPVFDFPVAASILNITMQGASFINAASVVGAVGAILQQNIDSLGNIHTVFPNWAGTVDVPRVDVPPSVRPQPYLTAASTVAMVVNGFNRWLRFNPSIANIAQVLPQINGSDFSSPGCFIIATSETGTNRVTLTPAGGDTIDGSANAIDVPRGGSVMLISDGVSNWRRIADYGANRFSPPEQWAAMELPAAAANVSMSAQVSTNFDTIKMMRAGSVVGLSTRLTEAVTAGTLTIEVTINGALALALSHTSVSNASGGQVTQSPGTTGARFVAGDLVGVRYSTTAGFTPTTTDAEAWIEIEEQP